MAKVAGESSPGEICEIGQARLRAGDLDAARDALERCLKLMPHSAPALTSLALIYLHQQLHSRALRAITRAVELRPSNDGDLHNRAVVFTAMGQHREAIRDYERALVLNPRSGGTHNNLAWLLATAPDPDVRDGSRAVAHARRSLEIGLNGAWLDTLAAALAELGDFEQAVEVGQRAYEMSQLRNDSFRQRVAIYQQHVSYAMWRQQQKVKRHSPERKPQKEMEQDLREGADENTEKEVRAWASSAPTTVTRFPTDAAVPVRSECGAPLVRAEGEQGAQDELNTAELQKRGR